MSTEYGISPAYKGADAVIVNTCGFLDSAKAESLEAIGEAIILKSGLAVDGVLAESVSQQNDLWALRENIPEANRRIGSVSSHDISLPLSEISSFIEEAWLEISKIGKFRINCFGHLGDGNLQLRENFDSGRASEDRSESDCMADNSLLERKFFKFSLLYLFLHFGAIIVEAKTNIVWMTV